MAKKKKNKTSNSTEASTSRSHNKNNNVTSHNIISEDDCDILGKNIQQHKGAIVVTLHRNVSGKKCSQNVKEENDRLIYIHEEDAKSLYVSNHEYVIVAEVKRNSNSDDDNNDEDSIPYQLKWDQIIVGTDKDMRRRPKFITICKVKTVKSSSKHTNSAQKKQPIINTFSPRSPNKSNNVRDVLKGEARIYPTSLHERIFSCDDESSIHHPHTNIIISTPQTSSSNNMNQKETPIIIHSSSTPQSNAKSSFSFKSFVKSPSSETKSLPKESQHTKVVILPLKTHESLSKYLFVSMSKLNLRLVRNSKSSSQYLSIDLLKRSTKLLEKMIHIVCQDNFFSYNDLITVSFQGTKLQFELFQSERNNGTLPPNSINELDSKMNNLNIDFDYHQDDDKRLSQSIVRQLLEESASCILFTISHNTRIHFVFGEKESNSDVINNISTTSRIDNPIIDHPRNKIVGGLDSILEQIYTLFKPTLLHPELFPKTGPIRAPKGILIHGSSGCGKSLLAKQIEIDVKSNNIYAENITTTNDETTIKVDVTYINCASIQATTSIIGEAEKKLTKIFEKAEQKTLEGFSTLLVLDDVHLICPRRGAAGGGECDRVASTLLALMDGIGRHNNQDKVPGNVGNVAILAITSNPSLLDPALRRAGRLDNEIEVPNPDDSARVEIFDMILNILKRENICLPELDSDLCMGYAKLAKGFTGGDCALSVKEAVRLALRHPYHNSDEVTITDADIRQAIKNTKPSAIKSITVEIPSVPWSSIGGMDAVKRLLREAVELPMTHAHLFEALNIPAPRGVLLYGPPGCSKTLMARALATEGNMNFLAVKGPELLS